MLRLARLFLRRRRARRLSRNGRLSLLLGGRRMRTGRRLALRRLLRLRRLTRDRRLSLRRTALLPFRRMRWLFAGGWMLRLARQRRLRLGGTAVSLGRAAP